MGRIGKRLKPVVVITLLCSLAALVAPSAQAQPRQMEDRTIDASIQAEIIDSVTEAYRDVYIFADVAAKMEKYVREKYRKGEYKKLTTVREFTQQLTSDFQEISKDRHIGLRFMSDSEAQMMLTPPTERPGDPLADARRRNFGFQKLEILPGNIGYLDLRGFADAREAGPTAVAAMNFLANADAVIFDLRQNGGGSPTMIQLICSYLFAEPTHLNSFYIRQTDETEQFWTQAMVQGPRMTDVPVYVLTSDYTFSAAEEFTYNLKNLKRATIVGDTTGGGAHPVDTHFWPNLNVMARVPYGRAINPITGTNWEGTGVTPDIVVPADAALDRAQLEALKGLRDSTDDQDRKYALDWAITGLEVRLSDITIDPEKLGAFVGHYGPRTVTLEDGELYYQREDRPRYRLIPAGNDLFLLDGLDYFRIQFERGMDGTVTHLTGLYDNGQIDGNDRDS